MSKKHIHIMMFTLLKELYKIFKHSRDKRNAIKRLNEVTHSNEINNEIRCVLYGHDWISAYPQDGLICERCGKREE
jgi:hypothetical protein